MEQEEAVWRGAAGDRLNLQLREVTESFCVIKVIRFSVGTGFKFKLLPNRRFCFLLWQQILCHHLVGQLSSLSSRYEWNVLWLCCRPCCCTEQMSEAKWPVIGVPDHWVSPETITTATSNITTIHSAFNVYFKTVHLRYRPCSGKTIFAIFPSYMCCNKLHTFSLVQQQRLQRCSF